MPRIAKAALAALASAALALVATWVIDLTYLRYGADVTYSGYVPETPPPPSAPAAPNAPAPTSAPGAAQTPNAPSTIRPAAAPGSAPSPTATHGGVTVGDAGVPSDAGVRRAMPPLFPARHADGGIARPDTSPRWRAPSTTKAPGSAAPVAAPTPVVPRPSNPYISSIVDRRVERTAQQFSVVRAQARVMNAWDFRRLGPLFERPKVLVRIRSRLHIDRAGSWRFEVRGGGRGVLTIDDVVLVTAPQKPSVPIPLARGEHRFDLAWRIEEPGDRLLTYAAVGSAPLRSINARAFRPPDDVRDHGRIVAWIIGLAAALLAALLAAWIFSARERVTAFRRAGLAAGLSILLLGVGLRAWDYDVVPQYGQIGDELFVTWNGFSILAEGQTRGWSLWPEHYAPLVEVRRVRFLGVDFQEITPYFEHPPLMHLLVGAAAKLGGAPHWLEARISHTRLVPLALSSLALLLVMLLARKLDRRPAVALLAGGLHAFLPVLALQARLIKEDHLLTVLLLGAVLASLEWLERRRVGWLLLASVLAGIAPLAKIPGIAAVAAVFCIAWAGGGLRAGLGTLLVSLPLASLVIGHGVLFGWDSFVRQTLVQGTIRGGTWSIFVNWFEFSRIGDNDVGRGWLLLLWFGFFTGFPTSRLHRVAYVLPVFMHITATALASNWMYGWYLLPIYPFLCIGTARSLAAAWTEADGWKSFVLVALGPMYALQLMPPITQVYLLKVVITAVVLVLFAPLVVHTVVRSRRTATLVRAVIVIGLGALAITSVAFIVTYDTAVLSAAGFDAQLRR